MSSRSIWKGNLTLGLVNIPVGIHTAEKKSEFSFRQLDGRDKAPIQQKRVNSVTGEEVPWENIAKGYEFSKGEFVIITEDELEELKPEADKILEINCVVKAQDVPLTFFETPYYLEPEKAGKRGYALIREALRTTECIGIGKVVLRSRENLVAVVPMGLGLVMFMLRWPDDIKSASDLDCPSFKDMGTITDKEMNMAVKVVRALQSKWNPDNYKDTYCQQLDALIQEKIQKGSVGKKRKAASPPPPNPPDMLAVLKKSLESIEERSKGRKKVEV